MFSHNFFLYSHDIITNFATLPIIFRRGWNPRPTNCQLPTANYQLEK